MLNAAATPAAEAVISHEQPEYELKEDRVRSEASSSLYRKPDGRMEITISPGQVRFTGFSKRRKREEKIITPLRKERGFKLRNLTGRQSI